MERTHALAVAHQDELEQNLHTYKTNLIKESIRMGYNDLGNFYYEHGMLQVGHQGLGFRDPSFMLP